MMCAMYALFLIFWSILCCCYCKDLLRVQYWIGAVIFIGQCCVMSYYIDNTNIYLSR